MAQAVVDLTLGTFRDLLVEEVKFLSGVGGLVKDVEKELQFMMGLLADVDRRKSDERAVLVFFKEIRSLCYRIEDVVDTYVAEVVLRKRTVGVKNILKRISCSLCECIGIHEVGTEIADINADISSLIKRMENHGIMKTALERQKSDEGDGRRRGLMRRTYGVGVEKDFVGMKKDIDSLVPELLNREVGKNIVSICGMGGLGKTTLAEKIYHHEDIRRGFEIFAWVCISKDYTLENTLYNLLVQLEKKETEGEINTERKEIKKRERKEEIDRMQKDELVREVYKALEKNKCLVVLDDVWKLEDWKELEPAFPVANRKVLITTRNESVAKVGIVHPLGVLGEDEAWELLQKKSFITRDSRDLGMDDPEAMEQLGRQMVHKCGYLPLAISVLGGILSENKSLGAWKSLNDKIGVHMGEGSDQKKIDEVLSLSYDDLEYRLKPCFQYLSRFREDELITDENLCLFWMAEGLVSPEKGKTLRDVALRNLSDLASRSLVQLEADYEFSGGELNWCRVHDLLRDLSLAKNEEEEFWSVMDFRGGKRPSTSCSRRLAIYVDQNLDGVPMIPESSQSLRSLLLHGPRYFGSFTVKKGVIDYNKLNLLRFLYFERVNFEGGRLPEEMSKLLHLKSLFFFNCLLEELPSWVGDFPFLQALHLDLRRESIIPNVLWKIKGLKHLHLPLSFVAKEKLVLDCLDELETLENFCSNDCQILDVSNLRNFGRFSASIYGNGILSKFIDDIEASAKCLDHTSFVVFDCDLSSEDGKALLKKVFKSSNIHALFLAFTSPVSKLPGYEPGFFPNLGELHLSGGEISEDPMSTLEKLSNLRKLDLYDFVVEEMTCHANRFRQLRHLELSRLRYLEKWKVEKGAMPCLLYLRLDSCTQLDMIDDIRLITTLEEFYIAGMTEAFMKWVEEY